MKKSTWLPWLSVLCSIRSVMYHQRLFLATLILFVSSCKEKERAPVLSPVVQTQKTESRLFSKSRYEADEVNRIYQNLLDSAPVLKQLQERLDDLDTEWADSSAEYNRYKQIIAGYYTSANGHANSITDSVMKARLKSLLEEGRRNGQQRMAAHEALVQDIRSEIKHIRNLNEQLKVLLTYVEIQKYQRDYLPPKTPLEGLSRQLDQLTQTLDSLNRKAGD